MIGETLRSSSVNSQDHLRSIRRACGKQSLHRQCHQQRRPAGDVAADQQAASTWPPWSARQAQAADCSVPTAEGRRCLLQCRLGSRLHREQTEKLNNAKHDCLSAVWCGFPCHRVLNQQAMCTHCKWLCTQHTSRSAADATSPNSDTSTSCSACWTALSNCAACTAHCAHYCLPQLGQTHILTDGSCTHSTPSNVISAQPQGGLEQPSGEAAPLGLRRQPDCRAADAAALRGRRGLSCIAAAGPRPVGRT